MKKWLKGFAIPKTLLGLIVLAVGVTTKNWTIIKIALSILGIGISSKLIKAAQGRDPWEHEKALFNITKKEG